MIGIHINDLTAAYTWLILAGLKTIETRFRPVLRPFIGQRVAIIRTGQGPAAIVGTVEVMSEKWLPRDAYEAARPLHHVPIGSPCDIGQRAGKYGYYLANPQPLADPIIIGPQYYTGNRTYRVLPLEF